MISNEPKSKGSRVFGILNQVGLSKEDIQDLSDYLDQRVLDLTRPVIDQINDRMDRMTERMDRYVRIATWVYFITLGAVLSLPDQALLVALKALLSLLQ